MLKNKEIRHLIYLELIILLLGVILTISTNKYILKSYQEEIINLFNNITSSHTSIFGNKFSFT